MRSEVRAKDSNDGRRFVQRSTQYVQLPAARLSESRIEQHMTAERVRVDGELVTDLTAPAPAGTRVVIWTG
jgi:hypothetical protein